PSVGADVRFGSKAAPHQTIGNLKPVSVAHSRATSYAASACRITPVPGSFQSTRAIRLSAASVPSQTITTPECCESPTPTPPPWCNDTQVAPPATFNMALSSGQSETASLPSFIASVSRLGEATLPE